MRRTPVSGKYYYRYYYYYCCCCCYYYYYYYYYAYPCLARVERVGVGRRAAGDAQPEAAEGQAQRLRRQHDVDPDYPPPEEARPLGRLGGGGGVRLHPAPG